MTSGVGDGMVAIDAGRVRAVAVGIERYAYPEWDLAGCAGDAADVLEWVTSLGVPAGNCVAAVSVADDHEVAFPDGVDVIRSTTTEQLRGLFKRVAEWECDLLIVSWSGHGLTDWKGSAGRVLLPSDYDTDLRVGIPVEAVRAHLAQASSAARQVLVVDACANFGDHTVADVDKVPWPRQVTVPGSGRVQHVLLATRQGRRTAEDQVDGYGEFTKATLTTLTEHVKVARLEDGSTSVGLDDSVIKKVYDAVAEVMAASGRPQPTRLEFCHDGDWHDPWMVHAPEPVHPQGTITFPHWSGPDHPVGFVGRVDELAALDEAVQGGDAGVVVTQVATGMGGIGKSALAANWARRRYDAGDVGLVRWFVADTRAQLVEDWLAFGRAVGLDVADLAEDDAIAAVRGWFERTDNDWIVVFDNADDPRVLDRLLPRTGSGTVLVTSRTSTWPTDMGNVELGRLSPRDATELLATRSGRTVDADLDALVDVLDGWALLVVQAGAFLRRRRHITVADYRNQLAADVATELSRDAARLGDTSDDQTRRRDATAWSVWETSIANATDDCAFAPDLLGVLAYLAPDDIPTDLLHPDAIGDDFPLSWVTSDVDDALEALEGYSLVNGRHTDAGYLLSMHRVVASITRTTHTNNDGNPDPTWCRTALNLLAVSLPDHTGPHTWPMWQLLAPQITAATGHAIDLNRETRIASWLLDRQGSYLRDSGQYASSIGPLEQAANLDETDLGPDHPDTLIGWGNLANSYWSAGRTSDAIEILERVADRRDDVLGPDHRDTLTAWANLAVSYRSAGRTSDAIEILERVADRLGDVLGPDHPSTLTAWADLAVSYQSAGRTSEAIEILERVAARRDDVLGTDHPSTLTAWADLAVSYQSAGRTSEAIEILERVAARRDDVLGTDHPDTLTAWADLAASYWLAGRTSEAIEILERVAARRDDVLGTDHPSTLTAWANLAVSYRSAGRTSEAIEIKERVAARSDDVLGTDHPSTLTAWANLAVSYQSAGRTSEAIEIQERVAARSDDVLGTDHPSTLTAWANLAASYQSAGRTSEAIEIQERVAARRDDVLGTDHPDTLTAWANLAVSYQSAGRTSEAIEIQERVAARRDDVLGTDHPSTLTAWANLAASYQSAGRTSEAIEIQERVAARRDDVLGTDHPSTLTAWADLAASYWLAGRTSEAIEIPERVAARSDDVSGTDHPDTLTAWADIAVSYRSAGRTSEAIEILERVAAHSDDVSGTDHPDTLTAWADLAASYQSAGRTSEAIEIQERIAVRMQATSHPRAGSAEKTSKRWRDGAT